MGLALRWRRSLFLLLAAPPAARGSEGLSMVVEIDGSNFERSRQGLWLLQFYSPSCAHCKRLEPIYEKVADHLHRGSPRIAQVGRIDGTAHPGLASSFGVKGYPTIILLKDGE
ncbi:MAG: hypothetical protein SGPRY_013595, partial [Prymnesium sp.]